MDKRRIYVRVTDTSTGMIVKETSYDLNLLFYKHRHVLDKCLELFINDLRSSSEFYALEFSCFKDIECEGRLPF